MQNCGWIHHDHFNTCNVLEADRAAFTPLQHQVTQGLNFELATKTNGVLASANLGAASRDIGICTQFTGYCSQIQANICCFVGVKGYSYLMSATAKSIGP